LDEAQEQGIDVEGLSKWLKSQGIEKICKERRRRNSLKKGDFHFNKVAVILNGS
jgi:hypothetical protein